ncbi:RNA polymerase sigma factor [Streptomyces sp. CC228A]|uniref:RNA polymerase sigma factor n=1 Tax=Streptomyces sp. CC228A TaxID=2898186 RepID=UPI001F457314|nr:sigma-70 family RNA polymerase sigma factor [Streptomyces sp. CC228A]
MDADHVKLVGAAQAGDDRAREKLIAAYLPLLYNIVGRALSGHADVDDVVQEVLLRAVRDLPALRAPESFRSWLVSITLRQINTHWHRQRTLADRTTVIDEALRVPNAGAALEDVTILRLHMSDERRQVVEAGRWLDPDHRMLLSLWWQECAGLLSRQDIADAMGLSVAHAGVRVQRMREQLDLSRTVVAALDADPRCPRLDEALAGWDGSRTSVWRKRIARHTRDCPACTATRAQRVPAELLLLGVAPLAVPAALVAALTAKGLLSGASASAAGLAAAPVAAGASAGRRSARLTARQAPGGDRPSRGGPRRRRGAHRRGGHVRDLARAGAKAARRHRRSHGPCPLGRYAPGRHSHAGPVAHDPAHRTPGRTVPGGPVRRHWHCPAGRAVPGIRGPARPVRHV